MSCLGYLASLTTAALAAVALFVGVALALVAVLFLAGWIKLDNWRKP